MLASRVRRFKVNSVRLAWVARILLLELVENDRAVPFIMGGDMQLVCTAKDYMARELVTVHPETDAYDAILLLLKHQISGMPVVDDHGDLVGILSERDCLKTLVQAQYYESPTASVRELMSTDLQTITPDTDILQIAKLFLENAFRRLPVVEPTEDGNGHLIGQISRRDVLRAVREAR